MYSNTVNSFLERHLWGQHHLFALGPVHTYLFLMEKRDFFSPVWLTVHTYLVKTVTKNTSFQKWSPKT